MRRHAVGRRALATAALLACFLHGTGARSEVESTLEAVAGSRLRRGVARATLDVPSERLLRAMTDVAHWPEFMPYLVFSTPVGETARAGWEQALALPFPLRDRRYRVRVDLRRERRGGWIVSWHHVAGSGNIEGLDGSLALRAAPGGGSRVELRLWSDLGGLAPAALQEEMLQRSLGWILDGLRQQAGRCRYDDAVAASCAERPAGTIAPVAGRPPGR